MNTRTRPLFFLPVALAATAFIMVPSPAFAAPRAVSTSAPSASVGRLVYRMFDDDDHTEGSLFTSNPDGTDETRVTATAAATVDGEPNWSTDGRRIVFTRFTNSGSDDEQDRLFSVRPDGSGLRQLTDGPSFSTAGVLDVASAAAFSPDGRMIAFARGSGAVVDDQITHSDIFIMDSNGSHLRQLTHTADFSGDTGGVAWSPDGRSLVYAFRDAASGLSALFTVRRDGSHVRQLTDPALGADGSPDWSRQGLITFRAVQDEESGIGNVFTIRPDGSHLRQVTALDDAVISHKVGFSPDGRWIVFGKSGVLFTMHTDGSNLVQVSEPDFPIGAPDWGPPACHRPR